MKSPAEMQMLPWKKPLAFDASRNVDMFSIDDRKTLEMIILFFKQNVPQE